MSQLVMACRNSNVLDVGQLIENTLSGHFPPPGLYRYIWLSCFDNSMNKISKSLSTSESVGLVSKAILAHRWAVRAKIIHKHPPRSP